MIIQGDALDIVKTIPDESANCIVTSPPYYGLRDYGADGQIGLEPTLKEYLDKMVSLFDELRRVLRKDGTCWVNMGDSYASSWPCNRRNAIGNDSLEDGSRKNRPARLCGFKEKDLMGVPWRLAFALQDAGWYLRSDIIWHKPNPMPESVTDRPTRAHEYLFLLTKSAKYWYDADAIRTQLAESSIDRLSQNIEDQQGSYRANGCAKTNGAMKAVRKDKQRGHSRRHAGFNERWDHMSVAEQRAGGANARSVWSIATLAFREAHFATFPPEIPKRCILAGCPEGGTVLDPFAGSGTTLMVAKMLGRKYLGIELNPEYVALCHKRIDSVTSSLFEEVA